FPFSGGGSRVTKTLGGRVFTGRFCATSRPSPLSPRHLRPSLPRNNNASAKPLSSRTRIYTLTAAPQWYSIHPPSPPLRPLTSTTSCTASPPASSSHANPSSSSTPQSNMRRLARDHGALLSSPPPDYFLPPSHSLDNLTHLSIYLAGPSSTPY